ncbi:aldo/keto reductase [Mesorhizobium sp.]|uniref:aldo/keto reductase n=1 Tax=Mesorhizobium sp. TaxID=1871066 RepID=UPI000FE2EB29|nr:aldo/keto reductase [Mesorhizobium sp.]RWH72444.1 MAG: aldo/keto reductase [Mesorhizobium sp.]RWL34672.1 MAG: aldo/keto reductase [Mesorhizobium sp.]RWL36085.1 MAG: aldo/keto reductase [Mesorhizobium sp.]RWL41496.1 MAG: aldo/keto reductase [Mesorhizobium sp.]RWL45111.1 MAG: aldo/keto reductase [Mesorhizobium sp.]
MKYTQLGRSGLSVSRLCLGTMNFGPVTPEPDAHRIMDVALENGVNFFDTANDYGRHTGKGRTEEIIGDWFRSGGGRREKTVLATKLYAPIGEWPNDGKLSALNIRNSLDASLRRLKTDHVDLIQFHHIDRSTPWDEIWQAIDVAVMQGKVIYTGSSNFAAWHIAMAQETALRRQACGLVCDQSFYNLFTRDIEQEIIPALRHYGMGLIPWSPLNQGLLGGILRKEPGHRRLEGRAAAALATHRAQIEQYEALADKIGQHPAEIALAWLLSRPVVTAPIVGPRTLEQLTSALRAIDLALDQETLNELDWIFPPRKEAPEAFAW